jgi:ubiquinone biosynthesis protein
VVEELARTVRDELDYRLERAHMERFARLYADDDTVHVPRVHRSLSTARVLTIERVRGVRPDAPEKLTAAGLDPALVARRGTQAILGQLFRHGFFHADPHPGNLRVLPGNVICFLDYGMTGRLSLSQREAFADLVTAIAKSDADATTAALLHLTDYDDEPDLDRLGRDVERFIDRNVGPTLSELRLGSMLMELLEILGRHELVVPPSLFLTFKVLISIEGTGRRLDPGFNVTGEVEPFLARVQRDRLRPRRLAEEAAGAGSKWLSLLRALPGELRGLVAQARRGSLRLEFEHRRLEPLIESNERISNRLSFAIVLAALIIGSALIFHADLPPRWGEVPIVGLLGFAFAGVMGFWLLLSILRHGRM